MNRFHPASIRFAGAALGFALLLSTVTADPAPAAPSAADLARQLGALQQDGASYVRLLLQINPQSPTTKIALQLQIKQRRTQTTTEVLYQVLWPKERKGEAVLLTKASGQPATGSIFTPPDTFRAIEQGQMKDAFLGSDLSYEDMIENFFTWEHQALMGTEKVGLATCQILESKPGKDDRSIYGSVRTWVDTRRIAPLRVEKYLPSGQLARRIDTTNVADDDNHHAVPSNLSIHGSKPDSATELDGSKIRHDVTYTDHDFSREGMKDLTPPGAAK
jgi:hypothetical protein